MNDSLRITDDSDVSATGIRGLDDILFGGLTPNRLYLVEGVLAMTLVALTGWGQREDRRRTTEAGFDYHLVKPADLGALQSILAMREGGDADPSATRH